jgi:hypothetical protein
MASDGNSGPIPATGLVPGSQAPIAVPPASGRSVPPSGKNVPQAAAASGASSEKAGRDSGAAQPAPPPRTDSQALVELLNKNLNDSGQPDQFRVDPTSNELIQQINPANGAVVAQFSIEEFPALARSIGASRGIIDDLA